MTHYVIIKYQDLSQSDTPNSAVLSVVPLKLLPYEVKNFDDSFSLGFLISIKQHIHMLMLKFVPNIYNEITSVPCSTRFVHIELDMWPYT